MKKLLPPVFFLLLASLAVLSSISMRLFYLQALWIGLGLLIFYSSVRADWKGLLASRWFGWSVYGISVLLLLVGFLTAPVIRNTRSWLVLGPVNLQPVELAKVGLILVLAGFFSRRHLAVARWRNIFLSFLLFALPAGLTLLQPDLGSASVLFGIWFGFLLVSGLPLRRIAAAAAVFLIIGGAGWHYALKDYQRERILGVFYPETNALTYNYSVIQAKIAIGSAGFWGKGWAQGTQTQLGFLTEPSNDFILAALIEEWGLLAGFLAIFAFVLLIFRILKIGLLGGQNFGKFLALGASIVFGLHFLLNAGSTVGLTPVVGVPFPFLSYGGSNLLTAFLLLAMINTVAERA